MPARTRNTCHAPCIINTASGFYLLHCEEDCRHIGDHSLKMKDVSSNTDVTINWSYLGEAEAGDSYAPSLSERCETWVRVNPLPILAPGVLHPMYQMSLITITRPDSPCGFCCEKKSGHDGVHTRSGVFGPLGIKWEISW